MKSVAFSDPCTSCHSLTIETRRKAIICVLVILASIAIAIAANPEAFGIRSSLSAWKISGSVIGIATIALAMRLIYAHALGAKNGRIVAPPLTQPVLTQPAPTQPAQTQSAPTNVVSNPDKLAVLAADFSHGEIQRSPTGLMITIDGEIPIGELLGIGGGSKAYVYPKDPSLVVKLFRDSLDNLSSASNEAWRKNFIAEYELGSRLDHPHLVKTYAFIESRTTKKCALIVERIDPKTVCSIDPSEPTKLFTQLKSVCLYVSDQGICWSGDICVNAMITKHGDLKILDFGAWSKTLPILLHFYCAVYFVHYFVKRSSLKMHARSIFPAWSIAKNQTEFPELIKIEAFTKLHGNLTNPEIRNLIIQYFDAVLENITNLNH